MRRPRILIFDDYLFNRCELVHRLGGDVDIAMHSATATPEIVIIEARVTWPDELELRVFEVVEKTDEGTAHRYRYSYQARWRGQHVLRYERDPIGHPEMPEHKHPAAGGRIACDPVGLQAVVDEMWREHERRTQRPAVAASDAEPLRESRGA